MTAVSTSAQTECAVVILTMNEEDNIGAVLDSVSGWAAQVYVVDSGSTDKTVEVAERHGATVLHHCAPGAFVITDQRNWSIEALAPTDDWVLFLDADERATPDFLRAVETATRDDGLDGYYAAPRFIYQGTWLRRFMGYPNWHPRLVQTSRCRLIGGVWEDFPETARVGHIREPYLHFPDSKGLAEWVERHVRYATWEAREASETGGDRRPGLRAAARVAGPARPFAALAYHLLLRRGFLDGGSVWSYARRQLIYQLLILEARRERSRDARGLPR